jgi:aryl hydrocarbon receptor nuclear translocator
MAVSHMKSIRTSSAASNDMKGLASCQPSFLTDQELKHLIMEAANGFLFVVSCENARVLYVSDSIYPILNITQVENYCQKMVNQDDYLYI